MKAQSFLNYMNGFRIETWSEADYHHVVNRAANFYRQPFAPEKIPELFEDAPFAKIDDDRENLIIIYPTTFMVIPIPKNLNDLIRDLEREEIKLSWNTENEEVKKAFGL